MTNVATAEHPATAILFYFLAIAAWAVICATATGAWSQIGDFDHDINAPIDFEADRLEVQRENRLATFTGNVRAVQGDLVLSADELKVYFQATGPSDLSEFDIEEIESGFSVDRIDAEGNIALRSPNESVRGDWAIYDIEREMVTVGGEVILTRGTTEIQGNRLELDLAQGRSKIESVAGTERPRVRGTFVPQTDNGE